MPVHIDPICPRCGSPVRRIVGGGVCARCLLEAALSEPLLNGRAGIGGKAEAELSPGLGRLGRYELVAEMAHGGMGVVYRARDLSLNRVVARS